MITKKTLKLAAKAYGNLLFVKDMNAYIHIDEQGNRGSWWNPYSDGDCFKLAQKLNMAIDFDEGIVHRWDTPSQSFGGDTGQTVHEAVLKVAAGIGEKK